MTVHNRLMNCCKGKPLVACKVCEDCDTATVRVDLTGTFSLCSSTCFGVPPFTDKYKVTAVSVDSSACLTNRFFYAWENYAFQTVECEWAAVIGTITYDEYANSGCTGDTTEKTIDLIAVARFDGTSWYFWIVEYSTAAGTYVFRGQVLGSCQNVTIDNTTDCLESDAAAYGSVQAVLKPGGC